ncbi:MAG: cytochrome c3 family protein [Candidatus Neomarinimicrobiota bacterium]
MNNWLNYPIISLLFLFLLMVGCGQKKEIHQPIAYNHALHIEEVGLDCTDCHTGVETEIKAYLPSIELCQDCHSEMQGESAQEALVVKAVEENMEIGWLPIYSLEDHVFFSHRRHVKSAQIPCSTCHGTVENMEIPPVRQIVPISMEKCMQCHDNKSVSNDCLTCHV